MHKSAVLVSVLLCCAAALPATAQTLTPAERAFFDQHISEVVTFEPTPLAAAPPRVFAMRFYAVQVNLAQDTANFTKKLIVAPVGSHLVNVSVPGSDADMPGLLKALNPSFRLATAADAAALQQALDTVYPIEDKADLKLRANRRMGNQWLFVRGEFFDDRKGFVFETDAKGSVTAVKYSLRLPK